jgi:CheY-like chemotaxis protein
VLEFVNVLLIDDDPAILRLLSAHLKAHGIAVATAASGEEALQALTRFKPELIISDVRMPGMGGYELCRRVRAAGHDDIPFLFCSAVDGLPERMQGLKLGADDYLVKPVDAEELVLRVKLHLERSRRLHDARREAGEKAQLGVVEGQIGALNVPDILQIAAAMGRGDLVVELTSPSGNGVVHLNGSTVVHAEVGHVVGEKALQRLLDWQDGTFRIADSLNLGESTLSSPLDACLLEGLAGRDEFYALRASFPGPLLSVQYTPEFLTQHFDEHTATVLSLVEVHGDLEAVLESCPLSDIQVLRILVSLIQTGVVAAGPAEGSSSAGASG